MNSELPPIPKLDLPDWTQMQQIPIRECQEPLQPASLCDAWKVWPAYFHQGISGALPESFVRLGVYNRLLDAAERLPEGYQLIILDGWRPFTVQQYLYDTLLNLMEHANPHQTPEARALEARQLVSPPSTDAHAPSPHLTGAAVDVTLADRDGRLLDMGSLFDEAGPLSWCAALESEEHHGMAEFMARHHRRILYHAMTSAGFTNLPSEWWHYDYGDQLWAWYSGRDEAIYGATRPPTLEHLWQQQLQRG